MLKSVVLASNLILGGCAIAAEPVKDDGEFTSFMHPSENDTSKMVEGIIRRKPAVRLDTSSYDHAAETQSDTGSREEFIYKIMGTRESLVTAIKPEDSHLLPFIKSLFQPEGPKNFSGILPDVDIVQDLITIALRRHGISKEDKVWLENINKRIVDIHELSNQYGNQRFLEAFIKKEQSMASIDVVISELFKGSSIRVLSRSSLMSAYTEKVLGTKYISFASDEGYESILKGGADTFWTLRKILSKEQKQKLISAYEVSQQFYEENKDSMVSVFSEPIEDFDAKEWGEYLENMRHRKEFFNVFGRHINMRDVAQIYRIFHDPIRSTVLSTAVKIVLQ